MSWPSGDRRRGAYEVGNPTRYEEVLVDGNIAARELCWLWFVPHFEFQFDGHFATVDVAVRPWFQISSFRFAIDGLTVYEERS